MLRQGGNQKIRDYFKQTRVGDLNVDEGSIVELYQSEAAEHYRQRLRERVRHLLSQTPITFTDIPNTLSEFLSNGTDAKMKYMLHSVVFSEQTLGMRLSRRSNNSAVVSRITTDGYAERRGVTIGDTVWAVNDIIVDDYSEILNRISSSDRPLKISFYRKADESRLPRTSMESANSLTDSTSLEISDSEDDGSIEGRCSPVSESVSGESETESRRIAFLPDGNDVISFDYRVTFCDGPLGITVSQDFLGRSEVTAVSEDGNAQRLGVRAGDLLVGLENRWFMSYQEAMSTLPLQSFPFTVVFRRYSRGSKDHNR